MDVLEKVKELEEKALTKTKSKKVAPAAEIIQLPIWIETTRGFPNVIARSALFNARRPNTPREMVKNLSVSSVANANIRYTGEELRQDDETVLMQLIHLTQHQSFFDSVQFTPYSFLSSIRWATNGQNYNKLITVIERLTATGIFIGLTGFNVGTSLIRRFVYQDELTEERLSIWTVWLEPEIIKLFQSSGYCRIAWAQRTALKKPLAQWLQAYYATHKDPYPVKIETIRDLSGSKTAALKSFRETLKKALDELVKVEFLKSYLLDKKGRVHVKRNGKINT